MIEEVVVVGSRIQKPDYAYSNPVVSLDAQAIQASGTTDIGSYLKTLPALTGSLDSNDGAGANAFIGGAGLSLLNLRNLGYDRTLVLVDGRRHVSGLAGTAAVDVDTIPIDLIERVEVMTGGASAIYGADGVSGVVNFVMKEDFEGVRFRAQGGQSDDSDADNQLFSVVAGRNFSDGRGNVSAALEYSKNKRLRATKRDFAAGGDRKVFVQNPFAATPDEVPLSDIRYFDSSRDGAVDVDFDFVQDFNGDDTPWDGGSVPFIDPFFQQGGDGTPLDDYIGDLLPKEDRRTANLMFDYEFSDLVNVFAELKYSKTEAVTDSQPTFDFFLWLEPDYAFTPPNVAAALDPGFPVALVSRDNFDLGVRGDDIERKTFRSVIGLEGVFDNGWTYEASYVYGKTKIDGTTLNNRFQDRFAAALDAVIDPGTGEAVCRSSLDPDAFPFNLDWQGWGFDYEPRPGTWAGSFDPGPGSGCVPVNIYGDGSVSSEAARWIMADTRDKSEIKQNVVQAYVSGDSAPLFSLPAGPVGFAFGAEYREEKSDNTPAAEDRAGYTFGNVIEPTKGDFDVKEVFLEVDVPLLAGKPGAELLSVDGAVRFSDYSTIGNATTWKVGAVWQIIEDVTFRGTKAEATRAPNIGELFDPGGQTFEFIDDPCDINELANGTSFRSANCAQILTALGVDPDTYTDPNSSSIGGISIGNPDLEEETADTLTLGVILRPRFIENLTISVDWYDIELKDAINAEPPQEGANLCVDLPTTSNDFCGLSEREPGTGAITSFIQKSLNVASFKTEGYDFTVDYLIDPGAWGASGNWGIFNFRVIGNKLKKLEFVNLPGAPADRDLGEEDAPEWQVKFNLIWQRGPLLLDYGFDYFDETQRYTKETRQNNPDIADPKYWDYDEKMVHNIYAAYDFSEKFTLSGGIDNFTNEKPDIGETFYPVSAVGRFYFLGFEVNL